MACADTMRLDPRLNIPSADNTALVIAWSVVKPSWNPLKCRGTDLPLNLTVMVKVLAIVVLLVNHVRILPDPWLPFIPGIDQIPPLLFQRTLQTGFVLSAIAIVFNRRVRLASLILGATMLLAVVSSKAYYGNNKTFCGLMFFLAGLYKPGGPNFIKWQLAITYFGAGLNKALDPDWHSGVFFQNWAVNRLRQPWYIALDSKLPPMLLAKFMCWSTIVTELATVPCLLLPSLQYWAVLANIFFQSSLLLFTGTTFTLFFYSMTAASFAFFNWPTEPVPVFYDAGSALTQRVKSFFSAWDLDGLFRWVPRQPDDQDSLALAIGRPRLFRLSRSAHDAPPESDHVYRDCRLHCSLGRLGRPSRPLQKADCPHQSRGLDAPAGVDFRHADRTAGITSRIGPSQQTVTDIVVCRENEAMSGSRTDLERFSSAWPGI